MRYRLVCLDAGFTLLAPRRTLSDALRGVLTEHGHEVTDDQVHAAWQVADRWSWDDPAFFRLAASITSLSDRPPIVLGSG